MKKYDDEKVEDVVYGESYFFIAGYTSGGAPYGITMEEAREQGLLEDDESEKAKVQKWLEENNLSSDEDLELPF
ncbi:MAG: hypothetical protein L0J48_06685 [Alkalibacterium sp.]|uniref:Uncharacterized protein n=1 Tax=Alkalibacterium gilvum TaxID=1130080 RepID=A0A1H6V7N1_9LACT|nr:hypothetical protein [Alkalibacterium gilvum]MDN6327697.1 hypothetical protein [Alkalibacterium sp.]MDN6729363.1 hypothetical protein [Alkalibacterium sp.]SEI96690.1 hypothetical protein SAMN04488113_13914 [Alkalibacterium gilvum]